MEALSPRDANLHLRKQPVTKPKATATIKPMSKEKDHPPPPPQAVLEPASSDRIDGAIYRTGKLLGRGGFAICYEARLAGTKQLYALKIVKSQMPQKKMEQKFQTELQIHSKMNHPNVVRFHRAFSYNQCTFLVLELCPNGSLMDMVKKRKFITEPEVRFWTVQMTGAIKYMHDKGIIHRDLKMGNIFLDKDMNVKIGDFGLAALLMSGKDWTNVRRTTLCGTPNYIAPEILSKDKQGHDHAVDIWSLGIIIFAMLTGKPPFQSTTADEIYRRAREREYDWPELDKTENFISAETKDLVSLMLQPAEDRPDPDTIVQHPFFTCGYMPLSEEILPEFREATPTSNRFLSVEARGGKSALNIRNLKRLCAMCGVGPWGSSQKRQQSTYREVAAEEKAGLTPAIPLPEGIVYRPFNEWLREKADQFNGNENIKTTAEQADQAVDKILEEPPQRVEPPLPSSRPVAQSFAAQQRARPGLSQQPSRGVKSRQTSSDTVSKLPTSSSRPIVNISARVARPRKGDPKYTEDVADVQDRLAADIVKQLPARTARSGPVVEEMPKIQDKSHSLFSTREKVERLQNTKPDDVLRSLQNLQHELERALNSRTTAIETKTLHPALTLVVKWVDYTNKHGLGYILSNGSIGCIFSTTQVDSSDTTKGSLPPCSVIVRDAEHHLQNRENTSYPDRHEIVPIRGSHIEFFESRGEAGIVCGKVLPINFKLAPGKPGTSGRAAEAGKLEPGADEWDHRKREKLILWKKFANYMVSYGRDQNYPNDNAAKRDLEKKPEHKPSGNVITFYQRWGDVGCWGFGDGHFQFNFPDHTKIVISADGTWCDFYHLPIDAARDIASKGTLSPSALDDRQNLSFPLQTLLNFMTKPTKSTTRKRPEIDPMIQGIPQANDFRRKIEFIRSAIKEWVSNGGLGNSNMEAEHRLRWTGCREIVNTKPEYKHVWVTVGARNGDDRRVAWFDPRKPGEIRPDMEPSKS